MCVIGSEIYAPDFSSLFNWNVKQLFVYVVAEYSTAKHVCLLALGLSAAKIILFLLLRLLQFLVPHPRYEQFLLILSVTYLVVNTIFSCSFPRCLLQQPINQIVLWDKIILRGDQDAFKLENVRTKYPFFDSGDGLRLVHQQYLYRSIQRPLLVAFIAYSTHCSSRLYHTTTTVARIIEYS